MKDKWYLFFALSIFFGCFVVPIRKETPKEVYKNHSAEVVKVSPFVHKEGHGSGILLNKQGYILTAAHVASMCKNAFLIQTSDGRVYSAGILAVDPADDLAILQPTSYRENLADTAKFAKKNPEIGEYIVHIGNPLFFPTLTSFGIVSDYMQGFIISDTWLNHGSSGGALYNLSGEIIGLADALTLTLDGLPPLSIFVPVEKINKFLSEWKDIIK